MASDKLTKNQKLVLDVLSASAGPLSAYDILDRVRIHGMRSPLQVYRALGPLVDHGHVHRLESISAFVACAHPHDHAHPQERAHGPIAFAICETCGQVDEFSDMTVAERLKGWADENGFKLAKTTVELRGTCRTCLAA